MTLGEDILRIDEGDSLRSRKWSYTLGYRSLTDLTRPARAVSLSLLCVGHEAADALRRVTDRDMALGTPGTLSFGGWEQRCLVPESSTDTWRPGVMLVELTCCLLDGVWRRLSEAEFRAQPETAGLDYAHDYPHDYAGGRSKTTVDVSGYLGGAVKLTVKGPATDPSVTLGGNAYAWSGTVPAGYSLVIDGAAKTCVLRSEHGVEENALDGLALGSGEGCGEYGFERAPEGISKVSWDGTFAFLLGVYEEEGEPPWSLSYRG